MLAVSIFMKTFTATTYMYFYCIHCIHFSQLCWMCCSSRKQTLLESVLVYVLLITNIIILNYISNTLKPNFKASSNYVLINVNSLGITFFRIIRMVFEWRDMFVWCMYCIVSIIYLDCFLFVWNVGFLSFLMILVFLIERIANFGLQKQI